MAGILGDLGGVGVTVTVDQDSINSITKMLVMIVAIALVLWVVAKKVADK